MCVGPDRAAYVPPQPARLFAEDMPEFEVDPARDLSFDQAKEAFGAGQIDRTSFPPPWI